MDHGRDRWSFRRQILLALGICAPIVAVWVLVIAPLLRPDAEDLSVLFDQSVAAASGVLGDPIDSDHGDLEAWHESDPGGVNCRMHRHARWELASTDANSVIRTFERIVNDFGERHSMMVQPVQDDPHLSGEPRTYFIVYDGYTSWMSGGANEEGQFTLYVYGDAC